MYRIVLASLFIIFSTLPAAAQDPAADSSTVEKRLELAEKMHDLRSTRAQVDAAIEELSKRQPEAQREEFKAAMHKIFNYDAIERISIDAMVETYTLPELEAMVEYYSKPEGKSAEAKETAYAKKVFPEIIRLIDSAIMRVRTGQE